MIAFELLVRLACGDLTGDEESSVEEHVLDCTECARTLEGLVVVGDAVRTALVSGEHRVRLIGTTAMVERLDAAGLLSRRYALAPGSVVPCGVTSKDVYSMAKLEADLRDAVRIDLEINGHRIPDLPFEAESGRVLLVTPATEIRTLPTMKLGFRMFTFDKDGRERLAGEYTLDHTAWDGTS